MTLSNIYTNLKKKRSSLRGIEDFQLFLLLLLSFSIPFYQKWSSAILIALLIISIVKIIKTKKCFSFIGLWIPTLLFIVYAISLSFSDNKDFSYLENRLALIVFPLIFFTIDPKQLDVKKIISYFIFGCGFALSVNYFNAFYTSLTISNGQIIFTPVVNTEFSFLYSVVRDGNYFFGDIFSIFHQSTYFSYYLNFAIGGIITLSLPKNNKLYAVIIILFALAIFQLSSKIGILLLFIQLAAFALLKVKNNHLKILVGSIILGLSVFVFSLNPRGNTMLDNFKTYQFNYNSTERFGYSLRLMSWISSLELIKENPVGGVGLGDAQNALDAKYALNNFNTPSKQHFNAHNQFLQIYIECGLIGLGLLAVFFLKIFNQASIQSKKGLLTLLFFSIAFISFLFESVLNRYAGISFFVFFYCVLCHKPLTTPNINEN